MSFFNDNKSAVITTVLGFAIIAIGVIVYVVAANNEPTTVEPEQSTNNTAATQQDEDTSGGEFIEFNDEPSEGNPRDPAPQSRAYTLAVDVTWSQATHGSDYPAGAHSSPLVAAAHIDEGALFSVGGQATPGFKLVAETGATGTIASELDVLATAGTVEYIIGNRLDSPGAETVELQFDQARPLLSLATMLAPSPDWVIGVQDVTLYDSDTDTWVDSLTLELDAFDAGTDSGETFNASNFATIPQDPISTPIEEQFQRSAGIGFGTLTITAIE